MQQVLKFCFEIDSHYISFASILAAMHPGGHQGPSVFQYNIFFHATLKSPMHDRLPAPEQQQQVFSRYPP